MLTPSGQHGQHDDLKKPAAVMNLFAPIVPRHHIFTSVILIPNRAGFLASSQSRLKNNLIVLTANWVKCTRSAESTGSWLSMSVCVSKKTSPSCKHRFLGLARVQKFIRRKNLNTRAGSWLSFTLQKPEPASREAFSQHTECKQPWGVSPDWWE